jgi:REP element-mobilizing transposase RayT
VPRQPRVDAPGAIQHVIARGVAGSNIVADDDDRDVLVSRLAQASERCDWRVHAYCLMNTHVHIVVETPEPTLGIGMQRLLGGYAHWFNRRHDRYGHLFAGRFAASLVDTEAYAIEVCAYVVLNPVRAGIVRAPEDWKWSSYRPTAGLVKTPPFVETSLIPGKLHPDREIARELYRDLVQEIALRLRAGQAEA